MMTVSQKIKHSYLLYLSRNLRISRRKKKSWSFFSTSEVYYNQNCSYSSYLLWMEIVSTWCQSCLFEWFSWCQSKL